MFLSRLYLNTKNRKVLRDVSNVVEMHRTVMSMFPQKIEKDASARDSFDVLHRVEWDKQAGSFVVYVKSKLEPDFSKLPANYTAATVDCEQPTATRDLEGFLASLGNGSVLRFRLKANATRRLSKTKEKDSLAGKRVAVRGDKPLMEWLARKGTQHGFELISASIGKDVLDVISRPTGVEQGRAIARAAARVLADDDGESTTATSAPLPEKKRTITAEGVVFDGRLRITDRGRFLEALRAGIGTGKSYGFGLLSVAPLS